jgi:hypothetical protein
METDNYISSSDEITISHLWMLTGFCFANEWFLLLNLEAEKLHLGSVTSDSSGQKQRGFFKNM